jgi:hypothetical protein
MWLERAARYRTRAEEVRTVSQRFTLENRETMFRVAAEYERMAATMEQVGETMKLADLLSRCG